MVEYNMTDKQIEIAINLKNIEESELMRSFSSILDSVNTRVEQLTDKFENIIDNFNKS
jgi:hypothetical protein